MRLTEIAKKLRATTSEQKIVQMIKNHGVREIEKNGYTTQQNYPNGVFVWDPDDVTGGVMFGTRKWRTK